MRRGSRKQDGSAYWLAAGGGGATRGGRKEQEDRSAESRGQECQVTEESRCPTDSVTGSLGTLTAGAFVVVIVVDVFCHGRRGN